MPESLLEIEDLHTHIATPRGIVRAVDGVSLSVARGAAVGLVGESGSGKSMTGFSVLRLFPTARARIVRGRIRLASRDLLALDDEAMRRVRGGEIAMVFQDPATFLNPVLPVGRQVAEAYAMRHGWPRAREHAIEALALVGLPDPDRLYHRFPHELSGGMRQRVVIAMATVCRPLLLIADEPTTALDVTIQAQILDLLARLRRELGMALLLITHDLGIVAEVCETVAVMYAGRIVESGPADRVFAAPGHPYTQGLLASALSVEETRPITRVMEGTVPDLAALPAGCRFHPRCPFVMDRCRADDPPDLTLAPGHVAACWLHDAAMAGGPAR
ncbi:MAG: ABC transporter ATP-binding protein [Armatimonadota bacterium]|nr:ABC transporter ATP-binding protein [Armatimonadota bacterium]MDR7454877.1 ABC transporter ATP-binding protein [Armatimonadota bacterium]MDR7458007.1 ABC transporter ATP-binding protein [Armatimonadota bacterium]MDR7497031.1 ABC transporter ATP-binding protein [Armatimonadota bacterium]MDR7510519.1 ABC transporter ATP-binding protein [Armatimonadota bacterium]